MQPEARTPTLLFDVQKTALLQPVLHHPLATLNSHPQLTTSAHTLVYQHTLTHTHNSVIASSMISHTQEKGARRDAKQGSTVRCGCGKSLAENEEQMAGTTKWCSPRLPRPHRFGTLQPQLQPHDCGRAYDHVRAYAHHWAYGRAC